MTSLLNFKPLTSTEMAQRLAQDIPDGWAVNLGIGLPTVVADHVPSDREVLLQSENGNLDMGPAPAPDMVDPWLVNAGKQSISLNPGASLFHHADSLAMTRGRHTCGLQTGRVLRRFFGSRCAGAHGGADRQSRGLKGRVTRRACSSEAHDPALHEFIEDHAGTALLRDGRRIPVAVADELALRIVVGKAPEIRRVDAVQLA